MKKTLVALNAIALVFFGIYACKQKTASTEETDPCTAVHARDYSGQKAEGMITLAQAMEITQLYYKDYNKSHIGVDGKVTKDEDTKNIWYSLETLKKYIWAIEDTLCKQGCNLDSLGLGLHFYMAKYPDAKQCVAMGVDSSYAHHQTLVITATYKDGKNNVDFDPYYVGSQKCKPTPLKSYMAQAANKAEGMVMKGGGDDGAGALNHGGLIPPPFGDGSFPTGNE